MGWPVYHARMAKRVKISAQFGSGTGSVAISPPSATIALTGGVPRVQTHHFLTLDHLWNARHAAKLCGQLEPQLLRNDPKVEHRSLAITAVFFAGAFLDALVNEVIHGLIDPDGPSTRVAGLPTDQPTIDVFKGIVWDRRGRERRLGTLPKYRETLAAVAVNRATVRPFAKNRPPYKRADLLIRFRNYLVHFTPETQDIHTDHEFEVEFKNAGIVENQQDIGKPWFPNKALGAGLAQWACDSSSEFAESWWRRIGLRRSFDAAFNQLGPY